MDIYQDSLRSIQLKILRMEIQSECFQLQNQKISKAKFHSDSLNIDSIKISFAIEICCYSLECLRRMLKWYPVQLLDIFFSFIIGKLYSYEYNADPFIFHISTREICILISSMPKARRWGKKMGKIHFDGSEWARKRENQTSLTRCDLKFALLIKANMPA